MLRKLPDLTPNAAAVENTCDSDVMGVINANVNQNWLASEVICCHILTLIVILQVFFLDGRFFVGKFIQRIEIAS